MKPSRKGTRLNDRHNFKQPSPHLRDRMTAMCVLSKISGLRDKIRVTATHDVIVGWEKRYLTAKQNKQRVGDDDGGDDDPPRDIVTIPKGNKKHGSAKRVSRNGNELTINIGLEARKRMEIKMGMGNVREKGEGVGTISPKNVDSAKRISAEQRRSSYGRVPHQSEDAEELTNIDDDPHPRLHRDNFIDIQSRQLPALRSLRPREPNCRSGGIGQGLQHWESMIATAVATKGVPIGTEHSNNAEDEAQDSPGLVNDIFNSKSCQFPSKEFLVRMYGAQSIPYSDRTTAGEDIRSSPFPIGGKGAGADAHPYDREGQAARDYRLTSTTAELNATDAVPGIMTAVPAVRRSRFKRMALRLVNIFGTDKGKIIHVASPADSIAGGCGGSEGSRPANGARIKTLHQRMNDQTRRRRRTCGNPRLIRNLPADTAEVCRSIYGRHGTIYSGRESSSRGAVTRNACAVRYLVKREPSGENYSGTGINRPSLINEEIMIEARISPVVQREKEDASLPRTNTSCDLSV